jgi:hypothetical protein
LLHGVTFGCILKRWCEPSISFPDFYSPLAGRIGFFRKYSSPPADLAPIFISFHIHGVASIAAARARIITTVCAERAIPTSE